MSTAATPTHLTPTGQAVEDEEDLQAWRDWMTAWEVFLDACLAMSEDVTTAPQTPDIAVPLTPLPAELAPRLARARALRAVAVRTLRERLAHTQQRPTATYARTLTQPREGTAIDL